MWYVGAADLPALPKVECVMAKRLQGSNFDKVQVMGLVLAFGLRCIRGSRLQDSNYPGSGPHPTW